MMIMLYIKIWMNLINIQIAKIKWYSIKFKANKNIIFYWRNIILNKEKKIFKKEMLEKNKVKVNSNQIIKYKLIEATLSNKVSKEIYN